MDSMRSALLLSLSEVWANSYPLLYYILKKLDAIITRLTYFKYIWIVIASPLVLKQVKASNADCKTI